MQRYLIRLALSEREVERYYRGAVTGVRARSHTGAVVQFPASVLRRFVTRAGVYGDFALTVDRHGRLRGIERLSEHPGRSNW